MPSSFIVGEDLRLEQEEERLDRCRVRKIQGRRCLSSIYSLDLSVVERSERRRVRKN